MSKLNILIEREWKRKRKKEKRKKKWKLEE
jgi:hypothetical protein